MKKLKLIWAKIFGKKKKDGRNWGSKQIKEMTRLGGRIVVMTL